ncbi:Imidazolonepropionase [Ruaniaceae bacterium KH17]|nr:Imidazolonepropionase [Ruaniaceae bacterium KH17]
MLHLTGPVLADDGAGCWRALPEAWVFEGKILYSEPDGVGQGWQEISGWAIPGLADVHAHIGLGADGEVDRETAEQQALAEARKGVLLIRDAGSPQDTRWVQGRDDLPRLIRAGRHVARPKRYTRNFARELEDVSDLPEALAEEARSGDGWVKLVADWIDRDTGVLGPLWPDEVLVDAFAAVHESGARVTAHSFCREAIDGLLEAGIDCIEHGTGMDSDHISEAARRGIAVTPTMIQIDRFEEFAQRGDARFPEYAAQMRAMYVRREEQFAAFVDAGLTILPGSDAGGELPHGLVPKELARWVSIGMPAAEALHRGAARARQYLATPRHPELDEGLSLLRHLARSEAESQDPGAYVGSASVPGFCDSGLRPPRRMTSDDEIGWLRDGDSADLALYPSDPREDISVLETPSAVILRGAVIGG